MKLSTPAAEESSRPSAGSGAALRQRNSARVLAAAREAAGPLRVAEIARITHLSRPTVETVSEGLLAQGWLKLVERPEGEQSVGRPARLFEFNERAGFLLGVDIGANTISVAVGDLRADVVARGKVRVDPALSTDGRLKTAADVILETLREVHVDTSAVMALTVGTPGAVLPSSTVVGLSPGIPGWTHLDVRMDLSARIGIDAEVENDANLAVIGECRKGVAVGARDVLFLLLGERLGAGMIANGEVIRGRDGAAGELRYVSLSDHAAHNPNVGPLEEQINATALVQIVRDALEQDPKGVLADVPELSAASITIAAERGDLIALDALRVLARRIARGIAPTILSLNPEYVIVGGGLSRGGDLLSAAIEEQLKQLVIYPPSVLTSVLGAEAVLIGALVQSLDRVESQILELVSA